MLSFAHGACLYSLLLSRCSIEAIDALKIDIEGYEPEVLLPFFRDAPQSLWPNLLVIEDGSSGWSADLFSELQYRGMRRVHARD